MDSVGFRKINSAPEGVSNWERFKAWRATRQKNIARFQETRASLAVSFMNINLGVSQGQTELAARAASTRILDKTV
ncbi:MAG TPA: hypothetical protein ENJ90_10850 [Devosia sp.]|nr:hypothetical protein [Devosia sp.]